MKKKMFYGLPKNLLLAQEGINKMFTSLKLYIISTMRSSKPGFSILFVCSIWMIAIMYCSQAQAQQTKPYRTSQTREYVDPLYIEVEKILNEEEQVEKKIVEAEESRFSSTVDNTESSRRQPVQKPVKQNRETWLSMVLNFKISAMDVGDVNGDGHNEIVVADNSDIRIYKKAGNTLNLLDHIKGNPSQRIINLDVADFNNNGIGEIIVAAVIDQQPGSYIIERRNNDYQNITDRRKMFFKVIRTSDEEDIFLAQKPDNVRGFGSEVLMMEWKEGRYREQKSMQLPQGVNVFSANITDVDMDGETDIVFVDERDSRLKAVSTNAELIWESSSCFTGATKYLNCPLKEQFPDKPAPPTKKKFIGPRLIVSEIPGDNIEIILCRNYLNLNKGEILGLTRDGTTFIEHWKTKKLQGCIVDYQLKDTDNDGRKELVIAVVLNCTDSISTYQSRLLIHNLRSH